MTHRYALRFEEGERRGEIVALTGATTTFGRKPGNSVQVLDPSVSGKHAEVLVDGEGALLRDLGSTNGTRVNGERISERRLKIGDRVMLGTIDLIFMDSTAPKAAPAANDIGLELEADEPPPSRGGVMPSIEATSIVNSLRVPTGDAGEAVRSIGAEKLARSGKKSAVAAIGLIVLAAGAGAAWWFTAGKSNAGKASQTKAVSPVAGNLLPAGYSFEGPDLPEGWANAATASAAFETDRAARASGAQGLSADLGPVGKSLLSSEAVAAGKGLKLSCALGTRGPVEIRAGMRFESSSGACLPVEAWGPWKSSSSEGELDPFEFEAAAPASYDRARALVAARSASEGGKALVDDVSIVAGTKVGAASEVKHDDVELVLLGEPAGAALLFKIDHPVLSGIRFVSESGTELPMTAEADPLGMRISAKGAVAKLEFAAEAPTAAGGIATTGRDGFKTHQAQFERAEVNSVLLGGRELVRLHFDPPLVVRGRPDAGAAESGASFSLEAVGAASALVQVVFSAERATAEGLVNKALAAQRAGEPGLVISTWSQLINEHPIDAAMIAEAEAGRAKALSQGLAEVATVKADVDRARFFRLIELFRECRAKALKIAKSYAGTEVEVGARALADSVEKDIDLLARDLDKLEAQRLAQIYAALKATHQTHLAERVANELKVHFKIEDPLALLGGK